MLKKIEKFLLHHELLIIILCLVAVLRLPSLLEPYWYGDEGIYLTLGTGIRHGLTLYRDIHDNKPPVIYLLAALSGSLFWFRFLLLIWNGASIAVFSWIATRILNPKHIRPTFKFKNLRFPIPTLATFATLLFSLLPFGFEGNIANGEIFMILPTIIGMALLLKVRTTKQLSTQYQIILSALAGVSFSIAFLTKVPAAFDAVGAAIFFYILPIRPFRSLKQRLCSLPPWIFGIALLTPIILSIGYYALVGAGQPYIKAALLQNVGYLASWKTGTQAPSNIGSSGLKNRALVLGAGTVIVLLTSAYISEEALFVFFWFAFALFGALLSERPYPHYLIQILPAAALLLPLLLRYARNVRKNIISFLLLTAALCVFLFSYVTIRFWHYPIISYYQNYIAFVTGKKTRDQYFSYFDTTLSEQYHIADIIAQNTSTTDRIFLWGDLPDIYALTRRLPPGRYTSAYHIKDFNGFDETLIAIYKSTPKIILIDNRIPSFPKLQPLLNEEYAMTYHSAIFTLYQRLNRSK